VPPKPPPAPKQKTPEELRAEEIAKLKEELRDNLHQLQGGSGPSPAAQRGLLDQRAALQARLDALTAESA